VTRPFGPDWQNPAWDAHTEALANHLSRLIEIHRNARAPTTPPESEASSAPIAPEKAGE